MRIFIFAPLLAALSSLAEAQPLTFEQALAHAGANAPLLRARSFDIDARRSAALAASQLPDPKLGVGLDNFPVSGPPAGSFIDDSMTMARLGISQDIPNLAKRHARAGRAEAEIDVAEAGLNSESRRVRIAAALAWIDLAYADRRLAALEAALARLRLLGPASTSSIASSGARPAQALEIRAAIAALEDKRSGVVAEMGRARAALARWTGDANAQVQGDFPNFVVDPERLRAAIDRHPELAEAFAKTKRAETDIQIAQADKRPDWGFALAYQRRPNRYGDMVSAGVTMTLPLFAKKRQDPMIAASSATANAARFEQEDMHRALAADLDAALADHVMHHEQWTRARDTLLPLARERADLETASYAAGRASLTDAIQAQSMLSNAELEVLDRETAVARDAARLVLTYGDDRQ
jgi:outer membrane protein TolC